MMSQEDKVCQYIVVDKNLNMSPGKMSAQVSHASMAFLTNQIQRDMCRDENNQLLSTDDKYFCDTMIDKEIYDEWMGGIFTKIILSAKGEKGLEKVIKAAENAGLKENVDFFCIRDACLTELTPDETGTRFTCIGFRPMRKSKLKNVVGKLQLYR